MSDDWSHSIVFSAATTMLYKANNDILMLVHRQSEKFPELNTKLCPQILKDNKSAAHIVVKIYTKVFREYSYNVDHLNYSI